MSVFPIVVGQDYSIFKGEITRRCTVLQSRVRSLPANHKELYVTYPGLDKRLDEWVPSTLLVERWAVQGGDEQTAHPAPDVPTVVEPASESALAQLSLEDTSAAEKSKTELRHEKERKSLTNELSGFRKKKTNGGLNHPVDPLVGKAAVDPDIEHHLLTRVRNFNQVRYGPYEIATWYFSPYPISAAEDGPLPSSSSSKPRSKPPADQPTTVTVAAEEAAASRLPGVARTTLRAHGRTSDLVAGGLGGGEDGGRGDLFVCDGCFKYMRDFEPYHAHRKTCKTLRPPGVLVYQKDGISIYEVDGAKERLYCQNLSLFGKLFIDQKTIFYSAFTFYVTTEAKDSKSDLVVGFFSKEKMSYDDYNLACIITFPPFQKRSFGRLMIEFSYRLTFHSPTPGTPERPLSDLGLKGYLSFWTSTLLTVLRSELATLQDPPKAKRSTRGTEIGGPEHSRTLPLTLLATKARLRLDDVALTLQEAGLLRYRQGVEPARTIATSSEESEGPVGGGWKIEEGTSIVVTREMVERLAVGEKRVRGKVLDEAGVRGVDG